jgi:hypothetical protein
MSAILGEFRNAADTTTGGWAVTDKIFGYFDQAADIYNEIRYPQEQGYIDAEMALRNEQIGIFGLQKPWGAVILFGGIALLGWGLYKIAK